jgi:hypothetical protein
MREVLDVCFELFKTVIMDLYGSTLTEMEMETTKLYYFKAIIPLTSKAATNSQYHYINNPRRTDPFSYKILYGLMWS